MKNSHHHQAPTTPFARFLCKLGNYLIAHADRLDRHAMAGMEVLGLILGLLVFYGLLLIGGAM